MPATSARAPRAQEIAKDKVSSPTPASPALSPAEYLRLHNLATDPVTPDRAGWTDALGVLAVSGDGYTLERLRAIDRASLTASQATTLDATIAKLDARLAAATGPPSAAEIQMRLERAAWADLHCDLCEHTLVPWATNSIAGVAHDPGVRAALERLRDGYEPSANLEPGTQWGSLSDRVRKYAVQILKGEAGQAKTTP